GTDTAFVTVQVAQRAVRVLVPSDTVRLVALGETQIIQAIAVDSLGYPVSSAVRGLGVADTTVVQQLDTVSVRSRSNGITNATFTVSGLPAHVAIVVSQIAVRMTASVDFGQPIVTLPVGASVPMT